MKFFILTFCDITEVERSQPRASLHELVTWSKNLPSSQKREYGKCLTNGVPQAMRWALCCDEVSKYHLTSVMRIYRTVLCRKETDYNTIICRFLTTVCDNSMVLDSLFQMIKLVNFCTCPIRIDMQDLELDKSSSESDSDLGPMSERFKPPNGKEAADSEELAKLTKRQFDAVSTSMIFSATLCDQGRSNCKVHSPQQIKASMRDRRHPTDPVRQLEALVFIFRDVLCCFVA